MPPFPLVLAGWATALDGDTLHLQGHRVRLHGIDAPELDQACSREGRQYLCGHEARMYLESLLAGGPVECSSHSVDRYRRLVAICRFGEHDVAAMMVEAGQAIAYVRYSRRYLDHQRRAQAAGVGLWEGWFETPEEWRRRQR